MNKKAFLIILDGWGHENDPKISAIKAANTPYVDSLYKDYPHAELVTYGSDVGLPAGQMGNSEVGHLNIGAGRIVYQELARINKAIADNALISNETIQATIKHARNHSKPIHLMGLLSDGGVHSHIDHIVALARGFSQAGVQVYLHMFLDGRDTGPASGHGYVSSLMEALKGHAKCQLSSIIGRYYAMDRDNRWERIHKAYDLLVNGVGEASDNPLGTIKMSYANGINDEFMEAIKVGNPSEGLISEGDIVFFANFRTDRPRQLTTALSQKAIPDHNMNPLKLHYVTMTQYDESYQDVHVVYTKDQIEQTIGEVVADQGLKQLRIAETEKYPHVTFFLSGGREEPYEGEHRIMIKSPNVATYDLQPEMSAYALTNAVDLYIKSDNPDLIILNYANADMVGHTGDFRAAVLAAETLDSCLEALVPTAIRANYEIVVIADHGNSDIMVNPDGSTHTAHTTNQVPIIVLSGSESIKKVNNGKLADVAPTLLKLMNIPIPAAMDGTPLV